MNDRVGVVRHRDPACDATLRDRRNWRLRRGMSGGVCRWLADARSALMGVCASDMMQKFCAYGGNLACFRLTTVSI